MRITWRVTLTTLAILARKLDAVFAALAAVLLALLLRTFGSVD